MKVLSLLQPQATLVIIGAKLLETRGWPAPSPRPQRVAVHASKSDKWLVRLMDQRFRTALAVGGFSSMDALPRGAIIGTVDVLFSKPVEECDLCDMTENERAFGDYSAGRFAWYLKNPVSIPPIAFKGALGLRELPPDVLAQIPERAL